MRNRTARSASGATTKESPAARLVERTTRSQGIPFHVEDSGLLSQVAGALLPKGAGSRDSNRIATSETAA